MGQRILIPQGLTCVHISDLHITDDARFEDQRADLDRIVMQALEHLDPDLWFITGDIYKHTAGQRSNFRERQLMEEAVMKMASSGPVVIVYGNHDPDQELDNLARLDRQWPIYVFDRPSPMGEQIYTKRGAVTVYPLPWPTKRYLLGVADIGAEQAHVTVEQSLRSLLMTWAVLIQQARAERPGEPQILASHIQVGGSMMAGGEILQGGDIQITKGDLDLLRVDYGAFGHVHLAQELVDRCFYAGAQWFQDHGETERVPTWTAIEFEPPRSTWAPGIIHWPFGERITYGLKEHAVKGYDGDRGCIPMRWQQFPTGCRRFLTLEYEWGEVLEGVGWRKYPDPQLFALVKGAEVRMRLKVPEAHRTSCPWSEERTKVHDLGAVRIREDKDIEVALRMRAPEVATATSVDEELGAYWRTLQPVPSAGEQARALELLTRLQADRLQAGAVL